MDQPKRKPRAKRFTFRVSEEQLGVLRRLAQERGIKVPKLVKQAILARRAREAEAGQHGLQAA